jgi:hypothetical protein
VLFAALLVFESSVWLTLEEAATIVTACRVRQTSDCVRPAASTGKYFLSLKYNPVDT